MPEEMLLVPGKTPASDTALVCAPPSKSLSHRALIAAALASGESRLSHVLDSDDIRATSAILRALGAQIENAGDELVVRGLGGMVRNDVKEPLNCQVHDSGTTCRLLAAVLAAGQGNFRLLGSERMCERPMQALTAVLGDLGAEVLFERKSGHLPLTIVASGLANHQMEIDCSQSSQFLSGLLLAAPLGKGLSLIPVAPGDAAGAGAGGGLVSWSYVQLTLQVMDDFGIEFELARRENPGGSWRPVNWRDHAARPGRQDSGLWRVSVAKGAYRPGVYRVEGDFSNASYFLAAGAVGRRPVRVENLDPASLQGDCAIVSIIRRMGGQVRVAGNAVEVSPPQVPLQGLEVNMADCPDLVPTVAAMAAFAQGPTVIRGVAHLRVKESDRIAAPAAELAKVGCEVRELGDGMMIIPPARLNAPSAPFDTYNDHRMAMSAALFSCAGFDLEIKNPACVAKSFPDFWKRWALI